MGEERSLVADYPRNHIVTVSPYAGFLNLSVLCLRCTSVLSANAAGTHPTVQAHRCMVIYDTGPLNGSLAMVPVV